MGDLIFHEYFHGDNGPGLGAAHQTGWTGLVADSSSASRAPREEDLKMRVWQGQPHPLGATWDGQGVNVAVFHRRSATQVTLCLFDPTGVEGERVAGCTASTGAASGTATSPTCGRGSSTGYGPRPLGPRRGLRYNPAKLLLDPYARGIAGDSLYGYTIGGGRGPVVRLARQRGVRARWRPS